MHLYKQGQGPTTRKRARNNGTTQLERNVGGMTALAPPLGGPGSEKEKLLYINTPTHPPKKKLIGKTFSGRFRAEILPKKILKVFCRDPLPSSSLCPEAAARRRTAPQGCRSGPLSGPSPPKTWRAWVQFPLPLSPRQPSPSQNLAVLGSIPPPAFFPKALSTKLGTCSWQAVPAAPLRPEILPAHA